MNFSSSLFFTLIVISYFHTSYMLTMIRTGKLWSKTRVRVLSYNISFLCKCMLDACRLLSRDLSAQHVSCFSFQPYLYFLLSYVYIKSIFANYREITCTSQESGAALH